MTKAIKSISHKSVMGRNPTKKDIGKSLYNVAGFADSSFSTTGKYGEFIGFKGDFIAVNLFTSETFSSNALFTVKSLEEELLEKLKDGMNVELQACIQLAESDKNDKGIAYIAEAPMTKERVDRQTMLLERVDSLKAIEAPKDKKSA